MVAPHKNGPLLPKIRKKDWPPTRDELSRAKEEYRRLGGTITTLRPFTPISEGWLQQIVMAIPLDNAETGLTPVRIDRTGFLHSQTETHGL